VSCETPIGAGFPRYDEIVKRFMKAFMKGFTSHGPNWGPGFASATHVLPRLRVPPPSPSRNPAGPAALVLLSSLYLSLFSATSRVFSIDPRKYLVFHHHRIRRRCPRRLSLDRVSLSLLLLSLFPVRASRLRFLSSSSSLLVFLKTPLATATATEGSSAREEGGENRARSIDDFHRLLLRARFFGPERPDVPLRALSYRHRAVRRVDVRFRVNWISSAFLFSN